MERKDGWTMTVIKDALREKLKDLLDKGMLERGLTLLDDQLAPVKQLLEQRSIPDQGWTPGQVRLFIEMLASMDTDKDAIAAKVGEREARVPNDYVLSLAAGFAHGIGRSGDLIAPQPKAPGGSILNLLASRVATSLLRKIGLPRVERAIVLPVSTGLSIGLCLSAIHASQESLSQGRPWERHEVIVPRVDHKSPMKGIKMAGFTPVVVPATLAGDEVDVPVYRIQDAINGKTAAILTTTAFFPPRAPDHVKEISKLCKDLGVPHVINNSYGIQSEAYLKLVRGAMDAGRVDYVVQSTDKNFLTPVGGAIVCSGSGETIEDLAKVYPGRASAQPLVQFLASVLSMGLSGYRDLVGQQVANRAFLERVATEFASQSGQRMLKVENPIAVAVSLNGIPKEIGGILYNLRVTGPRVVFPSDFGSCIDEYPVPYMTLNAGIGATRRDIEALAPRLAEAYKQATMTR